MLYEGFPQFSNCDSDKPCDGHAVLHGGHLYLFLCHRANPPVLTAGGQLFRMLLRHLARCCSPLFSSFPPSLPSARPDYLSGLCQKL